MRAVRKLTGLLFYAIIDFVRDIHGTIASGLFKYEKGNI